MIQSASNMELWTDGWSFLKTPLNTTWDEMMKQKKAFQPVELPHDWLIHDAKNLYEDSFGWYRKTFQAQCAKEGLQVRFDGVYMNSTVYVNGQTVCDWKYGYTSFTADITEYVKKGQNEIIVLVRHQSPNSRWYSGAGIYRNVWLKRLSKAYLPIDGTYVVIKPCGIAREENHTFEMDITTEVVYNGADDLRVEYLCQGEKAFWEQVGHADLFPTVAQKEPSVTEGGRTMPGGHWNCDDRSEAENQRTLKSQGEASRSGGCHRTAWEDAFGTVAKAHTTAIVEDPALWDIGTPNCYVLQVKLMQGEEVLDTQAYTVGFRSIAFTPQEGLFLNGRRVKIHGVCEHHDLGCLGAAFNETALRRQFEILREMGVDGIRTSHNPPAPEFMELADRMGFLVVAEAFDMWERPKTEYDYARFFIEWADRDVASWVRRDRNHPSLLLWSIGNEIYDTHADDHGQEITRRLMGYVRKHDPEENALITIGSNYMPWEGAQKCADIVKMAGYNYGEKYYDKQHKEHPDWVIYGSETASVVQSRGIYHFPLSQSILSDEDEQCSALGNSSTSWGADSTEWVIAADRDVEYSFGQFIWTGFDYIGEPTPYHTKNSYFGQIDTAGFPKDPYYVFKAEWTDGEKMPFVHLFPYWDFNPGQMIDVRACTNAAAVELYVNGRRQGKQAIDHKKGKSLLGNWRVPFEAGSIMAVAYDENGKEVARTERRSFGDSRQISLSPDKLELLANNKDLCFITIETLDVNGHPVENAVDYVTIQIEGPGRLLGMDNGDSTDTDPYKTNTRKLFSGKLLAVIAATDETGVIKVTATGEGLLPAQVLLEAKPAVHVIPVSAPEDCGKADGGNNACSGIMHNARKMPSADAYSADSTCSGKTETAWVPTRKIELTCNGDRSFSKKHREMIVEARVYPANAKPELIWKVVTEAGVEAPTAKIEVLDAQTAKTAAVDAQTAKTAASDVHTAETNLPEDAPAGNIVRVKVTALGDGEFNVRCMAKEPTGKITVISTLGFEAKGLGVAFLNPYGFISGGLCTKKHGDIGNGNEKGISTARDGFSGVLFENVDFGEYGSDEITVPIFALSGEEYPVEIWEGMPGEAGSELVAKVVYQKPSIWNVYQEETWKLPRRLKGVTSIGFFMTDQKVHIKGFSFQKQEKAFGLLYAGDCTRVYGDEFEKKGNLVEGIGNNVTMEYEGMDFGEEGAGTITIKGYTPLAVNTIHIRLKPEDGSEVQARMVEFKGIGRNEYNEQTFTFQKLTGKGRLDLIFLPGCQFNLESFRFRKDEE